MNRCQQCGQLRTLIWNLQTHRRLCWQCLEHEPPEEPLTPAVKSKIREGVLCLRCVQIESQDRFELLFVHAESNVDALKLAAMTSPGTTNMWARPVED